MTPGIDSPVPDRRLRKDAQRNRDAILAAARTAFVRHGVHVPLEWIARDADVGIGTLYRNFPTRDDLIDAVALEKMAEWTAIAEHALEAGDPWDGVVRYLTGFCERQAQDRGFTDVAALQFTTNLRLCDGLARIGELTARIVGNAKAAGVLRADVEGTDLLLLMWGHSRVVEISRAVRPDIWRRYLGLLLDSLRAEHAHDLPASPFRPGEIDQIARLSTEAPA